MTPKPLQANTMRPAVLFAFACALLIAAIYGITPSLSNVDSNRDAYSIGDMTAFVFKSSRNSADVVDFTDAEGTPQRLASWQGKVVLLNLWATWCGPCREEMPGLDRLQGMLGSEDFEVVALSVDRKGLEASAEFLEEIGTQHLALYADDTAKANFQLRARGLPATYLIDREGGIIGVLVGPAHWDSEDAVRLIQAAIDGEIVEPEAE